MAPYNGVSDELLLSLLVVVVVEDVEEVIKKKKKMCFVFVFCFVLKLVKLN